MDDDGCVVCGVIAMLSGVLMIYLLAEAASDDERWIAMVASLHVVRPSL